VRSRSLVFRRSKGVGVPDWASECDGEQGRYRDGLGGVALSTAGTVSSLLGKTLGAKLGIDPTSGRPPVHYTQPTPVVPVLTVAIGASPTRRARSKYRAALA
jgi:hypothetical protein